MKINIYFHLIYNIIINNDDRFVISVGRFYSLDILTENFFKKCCKNYYFHSENENFLKRNEKTTIENRTMTAVFRA